MGAHGTLRLTTCLPAATPGRNDAPQRTRARPAATVGRMDEGETPPPQPLPESEPNEEPPAGIAPAGWYPDANGQQRWWDGAHWGAVAPAVAPATPVGTDPRTLAMLAHLLGLLTGFVGPLVLYLVNGDKDPFVRHHAAESLNFQITLTIAVVGSFLAVFVLVGFLLLPVVIVGGIVLQIIGAVKANAGEWWRYPVNLRLVPGAVG